MVIKKAQTKGILNVLIASMFLVLLGTGCIPAAVEEAPVVSIIEIEEETEVTEEVEEEVVEQEVDLVEEEVTSESEELIEEEPEEASQSAGVYLDYSVAAVADAHARGDRVVLFFHASWCPYCIQANEEFTSQAEEIPDGVTVLKTDFDSEKTLKQKYGVRYQHTFVEIDTAGDEIQSWLSGGLQELINNIQ